MFIIEYAIERSKAEILYDMDHGPVPPTVCRFYQLHDYVDANEYGGFCDEPSQTAQGGNYWWPDGLRTDEANAVQDAIDAWLQELNPEQAKYEAEQDTIDPLHSYHMYRGQPLGPGPHDPIKWCAVNCPRCESLRVSKMELDADVQ